MLRKTLNTCKCDGGGLETRDCCTRMDCCSTHKLD